MTERERLFDLIVDFENKLYQEKPHMTDTERISNTVDHLLANGVIVPPCKVGDKVYYLCRDQETYEWYICEREVYSISVYENSTHIYVSPIISFAEIQIGVFVFLTKEEAEKALAERSGK